MNTDFRIAVGMTGRDIGAGIQAPHACIAAKQAYLAEIAAIDNVSRATWWANGKGEKLLADLGGKDGECYLAVMEHLDKKQKELKAALKRKS